MLEFGIGTGRVTVDDVMRALHGDHMLVLDEDARQAVTVCRAYLDRRLADGNELFYGINTGFGSQYHVGISPDEIEALQKNLILSHSAGTGDPIDKDVARAILLLKVISLCKGHSGVRLELIERLVAYYNLGLTPVIYELGSLGASGDLAPLAHMSLPLMGLGTFYGEHGELDAGEELARNGIDPLNLQSKEGLALINGTQFSTAHGLLAWDDGRHLLQNANLCAAVSLEAFNCNMTPFDARIHEVRGHMGQIAVSREIMDWMEDSEVAFSHEKHLQDPYTFRCVPQVHGATFDVLAHARLLLETEINAVTDNPLIFPESDAIISGGNFHAQPVAMLLDHMAVAIAELGSISERRTYQLLSGTRDLPACLISDPGLQSGLMIAQYTAASIVNRNKILCTPASADSIPSSMGQEDHVSMAANAGTKLREVVRNVRMILAIELLAGMQAIELRGITGSVSPKMRDTWSAFRARVPFIEKDVIVHDHIKKTVGFLKTL